MKKTIHALTIIDKSSSMSPYRSRTIEGINSNINALKKEVDADTEILNTQLQFSATNSTWNRPNNVPETDFVFNRIGMPVQNLLDMTEKDYEPNGGTPLLDAIGYGIEKIKAFHGDKLGEDNLRIIVTIFTDAEENSSTKWTYGEIKKMIDHFQSDGKWTFTFVGCGGFDAVKNYSNKIGISASNTVSYSDDDIGRTDGFSKISTSYTSYARSVKLGVIDNDLFKKNA